MGEMPARLQQGQHFKNTSANKGLQNPLNNNDSSVLPLPPQFKNVSYKRSVNGQQGNAPNLPMSASFK